MKTNSRIMIWGSNIFSGLTYNDSSKIYEPLGNGILFGLNEKYILTNFSMKSLDTSKTIKYISKALKYNHNYNGILIELGFYDLLKVLREEISLEDFTLNFTNIIKEIKNYNIPTYILSILLFDIDKIIDTYNIKKDNKTVNTTLKKMNKIIKNLSLEYNINYIDINKSVSKARNEFMSSDSFSLNINGQNLVKNILVRKKI